MSENPTAPRPKLFLISKTMFVLADEKSRIRTKVIDDAFGCVDADITEMEPDAEALRDFDGETPCYDISTHDGSEAQTLLEAADVIVKASGGAPLAEVMALAQPAQAPVEAPPAEQPQGSPEEQRERFRQGLVPLPADESWVVGEWYRRPGLPKPICFFVYALVDGQAHIISETIGWRATIPVSLLLETGTHLPQYKPAESAVPWLKGKPTEEMSGWLRGIGGEWEFAAARTSFRPTIRGVPIALPPVFDDE